MGIPNVAGVHGALYGGLSGVIPLVGFKGKASKVPTILRYLKRENS